MRTYSKLIAVLRNRMDAPVLLVLLLTLFSVVESRLWPKIDSIESKLLPMIIRGKATDIWIFGSHF